MNKHISRAVRCMLLGLFMAASARGESVHEAIHRCREAVSAGRLDDAVQIGRAAVEMDPAYFEAWKQYGRARMLREVDVTTLDAFDRAWALDPTWSDELAAWRIQTMLELRRYERFHLLAERMPDDAFTRLDTSQVIRWLDILLDARREEVAATLARRKASGIENPAVSSLLHALADYCSYQSDTVPRSVPVWAMDSIEAQRIAGMFYHHAGRRALNWGLNDDARGLFDQAVAVDSVRHQAVGDKGWSFYKDGRYDEAIEAWKNGLDTGVPNSERWMTWIGDAAASSGNLSMAMAWAGKALSAKPSLPEAVELKLLILLKRGKPHRVEAFETTLPGDEAVVRSRINARVRFGREASGELDIDEVIGTLREMSPDDVILNRALRRLAQAYTGDEREALLAAASVAPEPTSPGAAATHQDIEAEFEYLKAAVADDPGSDAWVRLIQVSEELGNGQADMLLDRALSTDEVSEATRSRLLSVRARRAGKISEAIRHARESLAHDERQEGLRGELFKLLVADSRFNDAGIQLVRLMEATEPNPDIISAEVAEIFSVMGHHPARPEIWRSVQSRSPYTAKYAVESASYLQGLCRIEDAAAVLQALAEHGVADARVFALLAELQFSLGQYAAAIGSVDRGLALEPLPGFYRQRAELAEIAFDWPAAESNALLCLESDPGYVHMHRLATRAMMANRAYEKTIEYSAGLIERNPQYLQGHLDMRNAYTRLGDHRKALDHAVTGRDLLPGDPEAIRRLAISYAEYKRLPRALSLMDEVAELELGQAVPIVLFRDVSACGVQGENTVEQVAQQIELLTAAGYMFETPDALSFEPGASTNRIMIVIVNPEPAAFERLDAVLMETGARAVLAVDAPAFQRALSRAGSTLTFEDAVASGRWFPAASGPVSLSRVRIRADGRLTGNPLTHRIRIGGELETLGEMEERLDALFAEMAQSLPDDYPVLVYPFGDYGQLSLDCIKGEIRVLRETVARHFKAAIAHGDSGFVIPGYDPYRIPAKSIPAPAFIASTTFEGETSLPDYLKPRNPVLRAKFDMAKLYYWHRQYQRANARFREAYDLGVEPAEVLFNWGANAFRQGDLPTALDRLRRAREIGGLDQEKILDALYQAEQAKALRVALTVSGWDDSDDREFLEWGISGGLHVRDDLKLGVFVGDVRHEREGVGEETGVRTGAEVKWYVMPERWITAKIWLMDFDSPEIDDHIGGTVNLHAESRALNGNIDLSISRDQVATVEAVREEVLADSAGLKLYTFLADRLDVYAGGDYIARTDDNDTWFLGGRILYRVMDWPYLGAGYRVRYGDSDEDSSFYYAPLELERHTIFVSLRATFDPVNFSLSGEWGKAREEQGDWVDVWSARAQASMRVYGELEAFGGLSHLETPTYELDTFNAGLQIRF